MALRLQGRYVLATITLLVVMIAVISAVLFVVTEQEQSQLQAQLTAGTSQNLEQALQKRAEGLTDYLNNALFDSLYYYNPEGAYHIIRAALSLDGVAGVYIIDAAGNIFHDGTKSLVDFGRRYHDEKALQQVLEDGRDYQNIVDDRLILGRSIRAGNEVIGALFTEFWLLDIRNSVQQMTALVGEVHQQSSRKLLMSVSLTAIVLFAVGILSAVLIARSLTHPLRQLIRYTDRLGKGSFNTLDFVNRRDEIGELAQSFNRMGQKLQQRTAEISYQAYHDALTGLPNRARFIEYIDSLINIRTCQYLAVLFIDLDEFKSVNDNYGHKAGDVLLQELAARLKGRLRLGDVVLPLTHEGDKSEVVARIGGDEFLICLPNISTPEETVKVAERLLDAIRSPVSIGKEQVMIGGSIGIASYPQAGQSADALIRNADIAMYHAKAKGKNTYSYFTPQMNEQVEKRIDIERELRKALESPTQFELWYQPQVDLQSGCLVGAEALVRWRHPQRGLIAPDEFIPVAEESGLIIALGEALVEQLCRQLQHWQAKTPSGFYIALNLSAKQLYRQDLAALFSRYLKKYGVPAPRVHAEITETFLMQDERTAKEALDSLRRLGVQVWLDDFGTGFSSLSYLRRFQVDGLKIDRSFIADLEEDPQDRALTAAIISMANSLAIPVVAEGIEKPVQVELLRQQRCFLGQGFYFSAPLPAAEFETSCLLKSEYETQLS